MKRREFLKSAAAAVSVISVSGCSNIDLFSGKKAKELNFIISKDPIYIITNDNRFNGYCNGGPIAIMSAPSI